MKKILTLSIAALLTSVPLMSFAAESTCDAVKADIAAKIINNGVPESGFELTIVPESEAAQTQGKVVGSCDSGTQRVVYVRHGAGSENSATTPAHGPKVDDTEHPDLQPQPVQ
ncbi:DUF1161 domain-containing protein [Budvicia diplopodorum]|uniref:DUF1161 domain-containing protein n=1 Tax=Budvicia diplopodorum TaxID=1119056 RepID=UPI001359CC91|nr:DUF1161 domain-containing protein [Budvicia diplopodorum]